MASPSAYPQSANPRRKAAKAPSKNPFTSSEEKGPTPRSPLGDGPPRCRLVWRGPPATPRRPSWKGSGQGRVKKHRGTACAPKIPPCRSLEKGSYPHLDVEPRRGGQSAPPPGANETAPSRTLLTKDPYDGALLWIVGSSGCLAVHRGVIGAATCIRHGGLAATTTPAGRGTHHQDPHHLQQPATKRRLETWEGEEVLWCLRSFPRRSLFILPEQ